MRSRIEPVAEVSFGSVDVRAGSSLSGSASDLRVDLGADARLELRFEERVEWPRRAFGGTGPAQIVPGLPQYWHPHLLGGRVTGSGWDGATVYAEKNWGPRFTEHWWWGQAQAFEGADACVAFAGGRVLGGAPTGVVVRVEDRILRLAPPFAQLRTAIGDASWRVRRPLRPLGRRARGRGQRVRPRCCRSRCPASAGSTDRSQQYLTGRLHATVQPLRPSLVVRRIHPRRPRALALGPLGALRRDGERLGTHQPLERPDHGPQRAQPHPRRRIDRIDPGLGNQRRASRPSPGSAQCANSTRTVPRSSQVRKSSGPLRRG